jgi:two-component system cell cycle sensor histidine kinase PleC
MFPGNLPIMAAMAGAIAFTGLIAAVAAVYVTVDALGAVLIAGFLIAALLLAFSGWGFYWYTTPARQAREADPAVNAKAPGGPDWSSLRLLETVATEVLGPAQLIQSYSQSCAEGAVIRDEASWREASRLVSASSQSLMTFAADLHDFARFERGRLRLAERQVDAAELVETALSLCQAEADAHERLIMARLLDGVELHCDPDRLGQAIAALTVWAMQASAGQDIVDVALAKQADGGIAVEIGAKPAGLVPGGSVEQIFEPFRTGHSLGGLRLPVARRVALLHGGDIVLTPDAASGTAVRLLLPEKRVVWRTAAQAA